MDSQVPLPHVGSSNANNSSNSNPHVGGGEFHTQRGGIPPPPFFQGFQPFGGQMPFMFPPSFMPPIRGLGFAPPPSHSAPTTTIDLTEVHHKRSTQEGVVAPSKTIKKKRALKKKVDIIELDDAKDEVDAIKTRGHWKDHWVIQLITVRTEMHSTFFAPPKQGTNHNSFFLYVYDEV